MRTYFLIAALSLFAFSAHAQTVDWKSIGKPMGDDTPMRDRFVYFNESTVGKDVSIDKSVLVSTDIQDWLAQHVAEVMTLDGPGYEQKVAVNKRHFTGPGYTQYVAGLLNAQVPKLLKENRYTMSAVLLETPAIVAQGLRENADKSRVYVWQLTVPVTLSYQNLEGNTDYKVYLSAEIVRIPMTKDGSLVALNAWRFSTKP